MSGGEAGDASAVRRVVLVTGPSGAGRWTAIRALEDMGFEAIDNLPLSLLPRLLPGEEISRPLAVGVDVRTRGFSAAAMLEAREAIRRTPGLEATLLYLDCAEAALLRRFSETRRRHPLAPAESPEAGLAQELDLLRPVREAADLLIDTSELSPHALKAELDRWFGRDGGGFLALSIESFSFRRGAPRGLDMMFDVRFLRNPHWDEALRPLDGRDRPVAAFLRGDARARPFLSRVTGLILFLLPAYKAEGKSYLAVGIGCTGGRHRSVWVAGELAARLEKAGWRVRVRHRELERAGNPGVAP
jgi:UPF0042 nucleotide-binding protein